MTNILKEFFKEKMGPWLQGRFSYAQEGEDLALDRLLGHRCSGFYVEVGCHHPFRYSNTYFFYKRGWSGICIDPLPGTKNAFKKWRPRDITVELGVARNPGMMRYHMFNEPALNTFDKNLALQRDGKNGYRIVNEVEIEIDSLDSILSKLKVPKDIDFFSIDVEGLDLEVLKSNDWMKYRPKIVVAEALTASLADLNLDPLSCYLVDLGYKPVIKTGCSVIFSEK
jgi:FkbM family methyltransferase